MKAEDTKTLAYQRSQKLFTDSGYIHRNDPAELMRIDVDTKSASKSPPQFKYCKLSDDQIAAIKDRLAEELKTMKKTAVEMRKSLPVEMITDADGNIVTEHTFRRMVSRFRNELLMTKKELRGMVNKLKAEGYSAMEVSEKLRNCVRPQYLRPILVQCGYAPIKSKADRVRELIATGMTCEAIHKANPDISLRTAKAVKLAMERSQINESK